MKNCLNCRYHANDDFCRLHNYNVEPDDYCGDWEADVDMVIDKNELRELVNKFCTNDCFNLIEDDDGDVYCSICNSKYSAGGERIECPLKQFMDKVMSE